MINHYIHQMIQSSYAVFFLFVHLKLNFSSPSALLLKLEGALEDPLTGGKI